MPKKFYDLIYDNRYIEDIADKMLEWTKKPAKTPKDLWIGVFAQEHGLHRQYFWNWAKKNEKFAKVYNIAKQRQENELICNSLVKKYDPYMANNALKNVAGWRDKQEVDIGGQQDNPVNIKEILGNPNSRRLVISAWNVGELNKMALHPCHCLFQFYVADGKLSCQLYQRSGDFFLGVPFNIASYALLTMMIAQVTGLGLGDFVHTFGDVHIYKNHFLQIQKQLGRNPLPSPTMKINPEVKDIFSFNFDDFKLEGYYPHKGIKAKVSV